MFGWAGFSRKAGKSKRPQHRSIAVMGHVSWVNLRSVLLEARLKHGVPDHGHRRHLLNTFAIVPATVVD